jgi:hypothetical protein
VVTVGSTHGGTKHNIIPNGQAGSGLTDAVGLGVSPTPRHHPEPPMPSPFPGMNPYLEQDHVWNDFHGNFIYRLRDLLTPQLRPHYVAKVDEHVFIRELPDPAKVLIPAVDVERLPFVEVRDRDTWEIVTVIELLSPCNKYAGPDREQFLGKRGRLLASPVHYVEIDLLRGGPRLPLERLPACDYYALVSRVEPRPEAEIWPFRLRDPLPTIPIPLRPGRADARLDLRQVLHHAYDAAGYGDYIYRGQPQPRLHGEDAAWAQQFVPAGQ